MVIQIEENYTGLRVRSSPRLLVITEPTHEYAAARRRDSELLLTEVEVTTMIREDGFKDGLVGEPR